MIYLDETNVYEFLRGYRDAMLWANTTEYSEDEELTDVTDAIERIEDEELAISPETWAQAEADCRAFLEEIVSEEVLPVSDDGSILWPYSGPRAAEYSRASLAGHDFALTRNHHGAGFWDRGLGEVGDKLTTMAQAYGSEDWTIEGDVIVS